jgi:NRPS condensation-like uncharacterized protein
VRWRALAVAAAWRLMPIARVARAGGGDRPGYGFELLAFSGAETAAVFDLRSGPQSINDVLLAALAVAIRRWNAAHDHPTGSIALTMPVNLRPAAWREEVVGNFASYTTVHLGSGDHDDLPREIDVVAARTDQIQDDGLAGLVLDLLVGPSLLPVAAKQRLQDLIPLTGDVVVDTASLSNLGRLDDWPWLGEHAGTVEDVWFSPPCRMPLGTALGAVTVAGRLCVALRYSNAQFDRAGAQAFAGVYRQVLLGGRGATALSSAA